MDYCSVATGRIDRRHMETVREIWAFLKVRKKFWLAPIIIALLLLGVLFFLAGNAGVVSPFVYAM